MMSIIVNEKLTQLLKLILVKVKGATTILSLK